MQAHIKCDVFVIGGGAAATRAAIEASDNGADVAMAIKMEYGRCGSSFYANSIPWGIMTAGETENDKKFFLEEILSASCGCIDEKLAGILVRDSDERLKDMMSYGVEFYTNEDKPCFGKKPRGALLISLDNARVYLEKQLRKRNVKILEGLHVHELIVKDNICCGALGFDKHGEAVLVDAKTVIMAAGGAEYLWKYCFALPDMTGDGYAMAAKHGARLANLEFIQFIPGIVSPLSGMNFHHPTLRSFPKIYNCRGEEFLGKYLPDGVTVEKCLEERARHGPFSCEDDSRYFDIALYMEGRGSKNEKCTGAEIRYTDVYYKDSRNKVWNDFLIFRGVDTSVEPLRIYPHCQGFNGGILIDEHCSTDIENLFACGECAGGPHGANRIGGNAILGTQVFGKIAGEQAAKKAKSIRQRNVSDLNCSYIIKNSYDTGNISKLRPKEVMERIRVIMQDRAFIVREDNELKKGIAEIEEMQREYNAYQSIMDGVNSVQAVNAHNSLLTGRLILYSMLNRKESRGSHYRADFPDKSSGTYGSMALLRLDNTNKVLIEQRRANA